LAEWKKTAQLFLIGVACHSLLFLLQIKLLAENKDNIFAKKLKTTKA